MPQDSSRWVLAPVLADPEDWAEKERLLDTIGSFCSHVGNPSDITKVSVDPFVKPAGAVVCYTEDERVLETLDSKQLTLLSAGYPSGRPKPLLRYARHRSPTDTFDGT